MDSDFPSPFAEITPSTYSLPHPTEESQVHEASPLIQEETHSFVETDESQKNSDREKTSQKTEEAAGRQFVYHKQNRVDRECASFKAVKDWNELQSTALIAFKTIFHQWKMLSQIQEEQLQEERSQIKDSNESLHKSIEHAKMNLQMELKRIQIKKNEI